MTVLKVRDLSFSYDHVKVLDKVSFDIDAGEFVILTGQNGAAKSTLIKNILGLLKPASGQVQLAKTNDRGEKLTVGYIPQNVAAFNAGFPSRVEDLVASGRFPKGRWFKPLDQEDQEHITRALQSVGMEHLRKRKIGELSGGQKQRINIARTFAMDPDFFVLDEPTTGMDKQSRQDFYRLLRHSCTCHNKAILMVTHADQELEGYYDREIHLMREEGAPWKCFSMTSSKELY
ncbi:metal ABC transporter ATP-binding protein [Hutsoniella sourekii]